MPAHLVPAESSNGVPGPYQPGTQWGPPSPVAQPPATLGEQLTRFAAAIRRYKWLIVAIVAVGSSAGYALTRLVPPKYTVQGSIIIKRELGTEGPVSAPGLISDPGSWADLARSFTVLDQVVQRLGLYVSPRLAADTAIIRDLKPSSLLRPGSYEVRVDANRSGYQLVRTADRQGADSVVETGTLGDSIGRPVGFLWQPEATRFQPGSTVGFTVTTPRDAAVRLARVLVIRPVDAGMNVMELQLTGDQPRVIAATMNTVLDQFVKEAARLNRANLETIAATIEEQMGQAANRLSAAERSLERFKVNSITLPSENLVVAGGTQLSTSPVFNQFFNDNVQYKSVQRDRQALQAIFRTAGPDGRLSIEALKVLPPLQQGTSPLITEIQNLETKQAQLRQLLQNYTDLHRPVAALKEEIETLETQTIPLLARQTLQQLEIQESALERSIAGQASELRAIPERTIEEARQTREVQIADEIYKDLQQRYSTARLAEASAVPDVGVLDTASVPSDPSSDTAAGLFLVAILASLGIGLGAAILLDRTDRRFRYPEQATRDLGLDIMSGIPTIRNPRNSSARLQEASQLVESFRSLSLTVRSAFDGLGPVVLTVSSPGPGDGKSFVSANLAMAMADAGYRTAVIDGDIRRGALHSVFAPATQTPGLTDYLAGEAVLSDVLRPTSHPGLFLVPCGRRRRNGPELLAGEGMVTLLRDLRQQFDAVICDSAPLGAGIDPFALGVATGAMIIVLRTGETDRRLAQAKLEVLDRMPVRVLGTVLNDIGASPQFKYYYYLEGYGALEAAVTEESALIGSGNGAGAKR
ncbi:MAG: polysaccharide biosynthesis tyrosine autokinase [Gemmatimonadaceae bacterium]|nr:polysaccharide biosynthesis tyrosine autokinase [Gemmatimonadaceae bacterium]